MTLINLDKAPFPYFGGKSKAAPLVWQLLGDPVHYVEPFMGSCAVLLNRPHEANRPYYSETCSDKDGFVTNFWRAVQWAPVETAQAASWIVAEADKSARQLALLRWRDAGALDRLAGDATWYDPVMAGWWAWALSVQIGAFDGRQAWTADPKTGVIYKQPLPRKNGNAREPGVRRNLPHVGDNGQGVNQQGTREPGVARDRPHLMANGAGVNQQGTREPGVRRNLPHVGDNGHGVNHAGTREPGILDPVTAAHGVSALDETDWLNADWGAAYHDNTMPELIRWFRHLSARLRHVRFVNGDWQRVCTGGAMFTLSVREKGGVCGVFLDPPYSAEADRDETLYAVEDLDVANAVRDWCIKWGNDKRLRIVLAGFDTEHTELEEHGWTVHEWFVPGHLQGGMGNVNRNGTHQQHRERLWASPHCLTPGNGNTNGGYQQASMFGDTDDDAPEYEEEYDDD